jgi:hypothetical protein
MLPIVSRSRAAQRESAIARQQLHAGAMRQVPPVAYQAPFAVANQARLAAEDAGLELERHKRTHAKAN